MAWAEIGKLYKSEYDGLVECVGIGEEDVVFLRIETNYGAPNRRVVYWKNEVHFRLEREATVADIEAAMENAQDSIENLRNLIDEERGVIRDLDEWRDRLDV